MAGEEVEERGNAAQKDEMFNSHRRSFTFNTTYTPIMWHSEAMAHYNYDRYFFTFSLPYDAIIGV
jgi:hypothetical protein